MGRSNNLEIDNLKIAQGSEHRRQRNEKMIWTVKFCYNFKRISCIFIL